MQRPEPPGPEPAPLPDPVELDLECCLTMVSLLLASPDCMVRAVLTQLCAQDLYTDPVICSDDGKTYDRCVRSSATCSCLAG